MKAKLILLLLISSLVLGNEARKIQKKIKGNNKVPKIKNKGATTDKVYKILFLTNFAPKSHLNVLLPLVKSLVAKGHEVTFISPYFISDKDLGVKEQVTLYGAADTLTAVGHMMIANNVYNPFVMLPYMANIINVTCRAMFSHPRIQELLKESSTKKTHLYDIVILNAYFNECTYSVGYNLAKVLVTVSPAVMFSWTAASMGMPYNPAAIPMPFQCQNTKIRFRNRLTNVIKHGYGTFMRALFFKRYFQRIVDEFVHDVPSIPELEGKIALTLTNHDPVFHVPRCFVPNVIAVPAMHCRSPRPLPKDLKDFVDSSGQHGFILFSMGTIVHSSVLSNETRNAFLGAFACLKQNIIWKLEETLDNPPLNVMVKPWIPQQDLLAQPNIRLVITHGGLFGLQEALYHSVPAIAMPVFGDQAYNSHRLEELGIGLRMDMKDISSEIILKNINRILFNESYRTNVKKYSAILKDVPISSTKNAVFWIEYVIRHQGAVHLQTLGKQLHFFQYFLLDVIAFLTISTIFIFLVLKCCIKTLRRISFKTFKLKKD